MSNKRHFPLDAKDSLSLLIITVIIFLFCCSFLKDINNLYYEREWMTNASYQAFLRKSILEFKQFPFWSPFFGGGYPFIGHPENLFLSPFLIFFFCFGEWAGYKLLFLCGYLFGGWGMYYLTRKVLNYNLWGAVLSALLFTLTSFFPYHLHSGNFYLINFFFFPILLSLFIKMEKNSLFIFFTGLLLALFLLNGMSLYWITVILFLSLFTILKTVAFRGRRFVFEAGFAKKWLIAVVLGVLFASIKIFPLIEILSKNMRVFDSYNIASAGSLNFNNLLLSLFSRGPYKKHADWFPDGTYADSVMYFGFIPIILCLLSFFIYRKQKETKIYFVLLLVFMVLSLGKNSPVDIFKALWYLPLFHSMHDPNRYFPFYILFIIALFSGKVFVYFEKKHKVVKCLAILLVVFAINDMFWANRKYQEDLFNTAPPVIAAEEYFYQVKTFNRPPTPRGYVSTKEGSYQYFWLLRNVGKIDWIADLNLGEYAVPKFYVDETTGERTVNHDYKGEVYFFNKANKAKISFFSPNKILIDVDMRLPDKLVVNQNYNNNWKTNFSKVENLKGLISIPLVENGKYRVELCYIPFSFYLGALVSLVSLTISIFVLIKRRRNDKVLK